MTRRLVATYLTITALVLVTFVVPLGRRFADQERDQLVLDVERDAIVVASLVEDALEEGLVPELGDLLVDYGNGVGRVVVVDADGISVHDSADPDGDRRNFASRPEIVAALGGERIDGTRFSETLDVNLLFVAVPVASGGAVHGAVRITYPTSAVDERVRDAWIQLAVASAVVLVTVAGVGWLLARGVTRPVRRMQDAAEALAGGDFTVRVDDDEGAPELRSLARTFNRTAERLDGLIASQRRFVADASHQLRTPLTALRLRLENFEAHLPASELPKLEAAVAEIGRLSRLVEGLLVLARAEAAPDLVAVDVAATAKERLDAWREVPTAAASFVLERPEGPVLARAVAGAVDQVLDNLIENAVEHSPAGGTVDVVVSVLDDRVRIVVGDEGPGMDAAAKASAFDRFWRAESSGHPGSGLGLAIVNELVGVSGGSIRLTDAAEGPGLRVVVDLRSADVLGPAQERAQPQAPASV